MAEGKWRDLPPIDEAERAGVEIGYERDGEHRISQTFLGKHDVCERDAFLYAKHEGGAGSHPMERGTVIHEVLARATRHLISESAGMDAAAIEEAGAAARAEGWSSEETEVGVGVIPPEVMKDLVNEVMEEEFTRVLPARERDAVRLMAYHFAEATRLDPMRPEAIVAVEDTFSLRIGNWTIRGRVDLAELIEATKIRVTDYKSSLSMPDQAEFEGDFQTQLYALALAFGTLGDTGLRIAEGVEVFGLRQVFPRYLYDDGLASRYFEVTRQQLTDFRLDLETQLRRLEANIETGKWQALPGSHCFECTSPAECPLPRHLRPDSQLVIGGMEDAEKLAQWIVVTGDRMKRAKARLKAYASNEGLEAIPAGADYEFSFDYRESEEIIDREAMFAAVQGAVDYGQPFERGQHVRRKKSTRFEKRKVKAS